MAEWGGDQSWDDPLYNVVNEIVEALTAFDSSIEQEKLVKQIKSYFVKGAKGLAFLPSKTFESIVDEYADNCIGSLFAALGDREWLSAGQVDFCDVLVQGIHYNFPKTFMKWVEPTQIEAAARAAHDRSYEENRISPMITDAVKLAVSGPKTVRKVFNAVEQGRKDAFNDEGETWSASGPLETFVARWVDRSIFHLAQALDGYPDSMLTVDVASGLFQKLVEGGALPLALTQEHSLEGQSSIVDTVLSEAYLAYSAPPEPEDYEPKKKKKKSSSAQSWESSDAAWSAPAAPAAPAWSGSKGGGGDAWGGSKGGGGWNAGGGGGDGGGFQMPAGFEGMMAQMMSMFGGAGGGGGQGW